tara:strand:+ start:1118 stop:1909 length:792 start_codon:yes stop_codon:yes gene_type:complete
LLRNVFTEYEERYNFATNFISNLVFDFEKNTLMEYRGAKILLQKKAEAVFRCNEINKVKTYSLRKQNDNNSIEYQKIDENSIYNKKFDCIISFESIQPEQYFIQIIEKFDKLLKDNGMLILSALNKEFLTNFVDSKNPSAFKGVTKGEFLRFLGDRFKESKLFSQRIFSKNEINHIGPSDLFLFEDDIPLSIIKKRDDVLTRMRKVGMKSLLTFDKNMSFYTKYRRKSTTDEILDTKINKKTYVPRPYNKGDIPLFFVAVCRK